jgi:hypothetical protein
MQKFNEILNFGITPPQYNKSKPHKAQQTKPKFKDYDDRIDKLSTCELQTILTRNGINYGH